MFKLATTPYYLLLDYLLILKLKLFEMFINDIPKTWGKGHKGNIILISGIHSKWNSRSMYKIGNLANSQGYRVHMVKELKNNTKSIKESVTIIENFIKQHKLENIIVIGYSKGGVIARYLATKSKYNKRINKIITIATPHKGSILATLTGVSYLSPSSEVLKQLLSLSASNTTNLYPKVDNFVVPNNNLILDTATNIQINVIGHTRILYSKSTLAEINKIIG